MLWEIKNHTGCVVMTVACNFFEMKDILDGLEAKKKKLMKAFLVRNEKTILDIPEQFTI